MYKYKQKLNLHYFATTNILLTLLTRLYILVTTSESEEQAGTRTEITQSNIPSISEVGDYLNYIDLFSDNDILGLLSITIVVILIAIQCFHLIVIRYTLLKVLPILVRRYKDTFNPKLADLLNRVIKFFDKTFNYILYTYTFLSYTALLMACYYLLVILSVLSNAEFK